MVVWIKLEPRREKGRVEGRIGNRVRNSDRRGLVEQIRVSDEVVRRRHRRAQGTQRFIVIVYG